MQPQKFDAVILGYRYDTTTSVLLAGDDYKDGNYERQGQNRFLYRTENGRFFYVEQHVRETVPDRGVPVSPAQAIELYCEQLPVHRVEFSEAFPGVDVKDA